jgi:hypothetical protein
MRRSVLLVALVSIILICGCTQQERSEPTPTTTTTLTKVGFNDFKMTGSGWEGSYHRCDEDTYGSAYVDLYCSDYFGCEVYVDGQKSFYNDGKQTCNGETRIYVLEEWRDTPDGKGAWGIKVGKNVKVRVCCSHVDRNGRYLKDYEYCYTRTIPAYC